MLREGSPSRIVLPPMPESANKALKQHNDKILKIFRGYAQTFVEQHTKSLGSDNRLPLTGVALAGVAPADNVPLFAKHIRASANHVVSTSTFVASSGIVDSDIDCVEDLIQTARAGIHLNKRVAPAITSLCNGSNRLPLNAYIWDFFHHGQVKALHRSNLLRLGDIWFALQDFSLAMGSVQMGLENYMKAQSVGNTKDELDEQDAEGAMDDLEEKDGMDVKQESLEELWKTSERGATEAFPSRPPGTSDGEWKVYRSIVMLRKEFDDKWRPTWA